MRARGSTDITVTALQSSTVRHSVVHPSCRKGGDRTSLFRDQRCAALLPHARRSPVLTPPRPCGQIDYRSTGTRTS